MRYTGRVRFCQVEAKHLYYQLIDSKEYSLRNGFPQKWQELFFDRIRSDYWSGVEVRKYIVENKT